MAVVSLSRVRTRVIELLLAAPRASRYTSAVGNNGVYAVTQEITDAIIAADEQVCLAIIETVGHPYRTAFMSASTNLSNGDYVPAHVGAHGEVDIDVTGTGTFRPSQRAESRDAVQEIIEFPSIYSSKRFHFIEDSRIYHAGSAARVQYPVFTLNTSACQAHEAYEDLVVYGAISHLEKKGAEAGFFDKYARLFELGKQMIRGKLLTIPEQAQLEQQLERAA